MWNSIHIFERNPYLSITFTLFAIEFSEHQQMQKNKGILFTLKFHVYDFPWCTPFFLHFALALNLMLAYPSNVNNISHHLACSKIDQIENILSAVAPVRRDRWWVTSICSKYENEYYFIDSWSQNARYSSYTVQNTNIASNLKERWYKNVCRMLMMVVSQNKS